MYVCVFVHVLVCVHACMLVCVRARVCDLISKNLRIFRNPDFVCISEFHVPKALVCNNINVVLQIVHKLQG